MLCLPDGLGNSGTGLLITSGRLETVDIAGLVPVADLLHELSIRPADTSPD